VTFNIQNQHAGIINNVEGDQHVSAPQYGEVVASPAAALQAIAQLQHLVGSLGLHPEVDRLIHQHLESSGTELAKRNPDRELIADKLTTVARLIIAAGAAAGATTPIANLLGVIARWLGPVAVHLRAVVTGLLGQ
jgi:hypothetical protein